MNHAPVDDGVEVVKQQTSLARLFWLLLALLLVVLAFQLAPERSAELANRPYHTAYQPPDIVAPTGELVEVFEEARAATLRIEARSSRGVFQNITLGIGTGFFISPDGYLLTAYHVVDPSNPNLPPDTHYVGIAPSEQVYALELVGFDAYLDLALLKAQVSKEVPYLPIADSPPRIGSAVVAIGNSRGEFLQPRAGRVSQLGVAALRPDFADDTIELTAVLYPGDSGGPVLNTEGEVLGVVSFISLGTGGDSTYMPPFLRGLVLPDQFASYAVPVREGGDAVTALLAGERHDWPVIGFTWNYGNNYRPRVPGAPDLGPRPGVIVGMVAPGSPAEKAGLQSLQRPVIYNALGEPVARGFRADVIVAIDGEATPTFYELLAVLKDKEIGQKVTLSVQRDGSTVELPLELAAKTSVNYR